MFSVSNSETMLKRKTNRWKLAYLTWNIVVYHDNKFAADVYRIGFHQIRDLCNNH